MVSDRSLDRYERILDGRILHGKLHVGAFLRRTGKGTRAHHVCPHACCSAVPATLSQTFVIIGSCGGWQGCPPPWAL